MRYQSLLVVCSLLCMSFKTYALEDECSFVGSEQLSYYEVYVKKSGAPGTEHLVLDVSFKAHKTDNHLHVSVLNKTEMKRGARGQDFGNGIELLMLRPKQLPLNIYLTEEETFEGGMTKGERKVWIETLTKDSFSYGSHVPYYLIFNITKKGTIAQVKVEPWVLQLTRIPDEKEIISNSIL